MAGLYISIIVELWIHL